MGVNAEEAPGPEVGEGDALPHGRFIVVEGIDGAGTTTLAASLADVLPRARFTCEPSSQAVGAWLRGVLESPERASTALKAPETLALLFAADRYMHLAEEVEPKLAAGDTVISDRYLYSSVGYQSYGAADAAAQQAWIRSLQPWARTPDLTLLVLVSPETAQARREARGGTRGLLEDDDRQTWLAHYYRALPDLFPDHTFACLNGEGSAQEVLAAALAALESHCGLTMPQETSPAEDRFATGPELKRIADAPQLDAATARHCGSANDGPVNDGPLGSGPS